MRPSRRARNLSVHVHPGGKIEVVAPARTRPTEVAAFVAENREWIRRAQSKLAQEPAIDRGMPENIELPAIGRSVSVAYQSPGVRGKFDDNDNLIRLSAPRAHRKICRSALREWLAGVGRATLVPWLRGTSHEIGIDYNKTQVRGQKTRWGSCSSKGTISINFCLLFLQPELVRYLFVHELCHRRHFNHSKRFWGLVEKWEPDYRRHDRRLADAWRSVPGWVCS